MYQSGKKGAFGFFPGAEAEYGSEGLKKPLRTVYGMNSI